MSPVTRIEITQDDIEDGIRNDCDSCPIALATHRATGDVTWEVGSTALVNNEYGEAVDLPIEAREFVRYFDNGDPVEPFSFEVNLPVGAPCG